MYGCCSLGFYSLPGSSFCAICAPGTYSVGPSASCALCPPGQFQNEVGQSSCNFCQSNTYQSQNGSAACTPCPYDFTAKEKQLLYFKDCRMCFNATSSQLSATSCCNTTKEETVYLNISNIRSSSPGILSVSEIEYLINSALATQKNIYNLVSLYQDAEAWSMANASGKTITLRIRYGGFQLRFDYYSNEYLGFQDAIPADGPTKCLNRTLNPFYLDGCMPCTSDFAITAPQIALSLKSR